MNSLKYVAFILLASLRCASCCFIWNRLRFLNQVWWFNMWVIYLKVKNPMIAGGFDKHVIIELRSNKLLRFYGVESIRKAFNKIGFHPCESLKGKSRQILRKLLCDSVWLANKFTRIIKKWWEFSRKVFLIMLFAIIILLCNLWSI